MPLNRRQFLGLGGSGIAGLILTKQCSQMLARSETQTALPFLPRGDQRIALISDLNSSYGSTSYVPQVHRGIKLLRRIKPDLVLCGGDMVAGQKLALTPNQLDAMWSSFDRQLLRLLLAAGEPFAPTMGNHDASSSRGPTGYIYELDRLHALKFWQSRQDSLGLSFVDASHFPFRYSICHGDVFVVVFDASSAKVSEADWAWAQTQLDGSLARKAQLRLLMGHLPPYAIAKGRDRAGEVLLEPRRLQKLLSRNNVHLYISGHHHAWYPSKVGLTNLLSLGAMGSGPRQRIDDRQAPQQTITLLDLFSELGELVETTIELNSLQVLLPNELPDSLQPSFGPKLNRRSTRVNFNTNYKTTNSQGFG